MHRDAKRPLVNIAELDAAIADSLRRHGANILETKGRQELVQLFKNALQMGREALRLEHESGASGRRIVKGHTFVVDLLLNRLHALIHGISDQLSEHEASTFQESPEERYAMVATGGYGRGELAPYSDIDLLFIIPDGAKADITGKIEKVLYFLWDLGLDVGQAVRTLDECMAQANEEIENRTSMLESRFLAGNRKLFKTFRDQFQDRVLSDPAGFLKEKLEEQTKRHERFGNSLFYLEPNIKENPGGLRDIHTLFWAAKYRYKVQRVKDLIPQQLITEEEYNTFTRAREFLWRIRNALHYTADRRDDRLTFGHQVTIAQDFSYKDREGMLGVEQFMRRYYQTAKQIHNLCQVFLHQYAEEHKDTELQSVPLEDCFVLDGDMLTVSCPNAFEEDPSRLMTLFETAQRYDKSIHPNALRQITGNLALADRNFRHNEKVIESFRKILTANRGVAWALRRMNNCGLLGRFIPEFGRIIGQTQHDLFHVYTVDEHSILAVEALRAIRAGKLTNELPLATELINRVRNPLVLLVAVLFHDIAKGRGGNHEIKGAIIAREVCPRLGLDRQETEQVAWLVRNHLIFSHTAFRRDVNDPETVFQFARQMGGLENMDMLLLLTVSDIRAVGPNVWNEWKASLLRRLYGVTSQVIVRGLFKPEDMAELAQEQREATSDMLCEDYTEDEVQAYLDRFYDDYFVGFEPGAVADHFRSLHGKLNDPLAVCFRTNPASDTTDMLIYCQDHPGLIERISGALAVESIGILSANGNTTKDGMALDIFVIQDWQGQPVTDPEKQEKVKVTLAKILSGSMAASLEPTHKLKIRKDDHFEVPTSVSWDHHASEIYTIMEITTRNRFGLLHAVTRTLAEEGAQINTCKIATYGEKAIDVFYLKDLFGLRLNHNRCQRIEKALHKTLEALEPEQADN
ncbi:[protein-PII] uridylyltransferase [Magnetococcus sp. PR-3]|uniref:[protein-PII] uridylyltransferase n=1 Tax=Magnetococcus sp. PR-3 TaxID=3120355 RepID=UPI002FCE6784